ncbi:MAG: pyridoxal phosphate-dependent aminotransferase [Clostridia bacterium]|nr:pyridoxal phosphate-dependent aminotransferase [Clostridia bacterium]
MIYDFDTVHNRSDTDSSKWMVKDGELPMWVADMDFITAPEVIQDLVGRAQHGIFGYTEVTDEWYDAYINWWNKRHGLLIQKESLMFCTGVVAAISSIVRKMTTPNENVLIQTPVYNIFFNSIINNGCRPSENVLVFNNGSYKIDFDDLEKKLADPQTSLMILCNPHNPIGKIWDIDTLKRIGDLCVKYNVVVISDEIHCDIVEPGKQYHPFASVSENCRNNSITCIAPTKTFNLAGLQTAAIFVPNPVLRHKVWRAINTDEVAEPNAFATVGAISAFSKGGEWVDRMNAYVSHNRQIVSDFICSKIPEISLIKSEATYLLWIDVRAVGDSRELADYIRSKTGLFLNEGSIYGNSGKGFLRMNIACPKTLLLDGLERLAVGIKTYMKNH